MRAFVITVAVAMAAAASSLAAAQDVVIDPTAPVMSYGRGGVFRAAGFGHAGHFLGGASVHTKRAEVPEGVRVDTGADMMYRYMNWAPHAPVVEDGDPRIQSQFVRDNTWTATVDLPRCMRVTVYLLNQDTSNTGRTMRVDTYRGEQRADVNERFVDGVYVSFLQTHASDSYTFRTVTGGSEVAVSGFLFDELTAAERDFFADDRCSANGFAGVTVSPAPASSAGPPPNGVRKGAGGDFLALGYGGRAFALASGHNSARFNIRASAGYELLNTGNYAFWFPQPFTNDYLHGVPGDTGSRPSYQWSYTRHVIRVAVPRCTRVTFYVMDDGNGARRASLWRSEGTEIPAGLSGSSFNDGAYVTFTQRHQVEYFGLVCDIERSSNIPWLGTFFDDLPPAEAAECELQSSSDVQPRRVELRDVAGASARLDVRAGGRLTDVGYGGLGYVFAGSDSAAARSRLNLRSGFGLSFPDGVMSNAWNPLNTRNDPRWDWRALRLPVTSTNGDDETYAILHSKDWYSRAEGARTFNLRFTVSLPSCSRVTLYTVDYRAGNSRFAIDMPGGRSIELLPSDVYGGDFTLGVYASWVQAGRSETYTLRHVYGENVQFQGLLFDNATADECGAASAFAVTPAPAPVYTPAPWTPSPPAASNNNNNNNNDNGNAGTSGTDGDGGDDGTGTVVIVAVAAVAVVALIAGAAVGGFLLARRAAPPPAGAAAGTESQGSSQAGETTAMTTMATTVVHSHPHHYSGGKPDPTSAGAQPAYPPAGAAGAPGYGYGQGWDPAFGTAAQGMVVTAAVVQPVQQPHLVVPVHQQHLSDARAAGDDVVAVPMHNCSVPAKSV